MQRAATPPFNVALIGAGSVGIGVATLLRRAGHVPTGVASRSAGSTDAAAHRLSTATFTVSSGLPANTEVVLIATPDAAIADVCGALAPSLGPDMVVCHFAGSLGIEPLAAALEAGAGACATHPVQACPTPARAIELLPGSAWGVTASPGAERWAERIVEACGGSPVAVAEADRAVWHAAAATVSNGLGALLWAGRELLAAAGVDDPQRVLGPLARGTVENAGVLDAAAAVTGPVVRGDVLTVRRHIEAIEQRAPQVADVYAAVARTIGIAARAAGRIDDAELRSIVEVVAR